MSTFAQPTNLYDRITRSLNVLRQARDEGASESYIARASERLGELLDRIPRFQSPGVTP